MTRRAPRRLVTTSGPGQNGLFDTVCPIPDQRADSSWLDGAGEPPLVAHEDLEASAP